MRIKSYRCPQCGREYNMVDKPGIPTCKKCGCELDGLTVYAADENGKVKSVELDVKSSVRRENREEAEQEALFQWVEYQSSVHPELKLLYHIPNEGKRSAAAGAALKKAGLRKGVPDLCLPVARGIYHGLYIELKAGKNQPTVSQLEWLEALERQGYKAVWCVGWEKAKEVILDYLKQNKEKDEEKEI